MEVLFCLVRCFDAASSFSDFMVGAAQVGALTMGLDRNPACTGPLTPARRGELGVTPGPVVQVERAFLPGHL